MPNLPIATIVYLNSAIGAMLFEIYNRAGLGEGARSMMVSDYLQVPALIASDKNDDELEYVLQSIYSLPPRKLLTPKREEWKHLDTIIFDALNLTQGEKDAVYEAVKELVEARLNKANSLKVSQERRKRLEAVDKTLGIWIGLPEEENEGEVESHYA